MGISKAMDASASALTTERLRMDVIANNLANINTTRQANGTPYRRRYVVQSERTPNFQAALATAQGTSANSNASAAGGVQVTAIAEDNAPFKLKYDPSHPDADANGMVSMPNIDLLNEITDMMVSVRAYEANVTAFNSSKHIVMKALEIGR